MARHKVIIGEKGGLKCLAGIIQSFDAESARYDVLLNSATGTAGWRWVKVKASLGCQRKDDDSSKQRVG
eukprot:875623-Amphidinium_carterae.1